RPDPGPAPAGPFPSPSSWSSPSAAAGPPPPPPRGDLPPGTATEWFAVPREWTRSAGCDWDVEGLWTPRTDSTSTRAHLSHAHERPVTHQCATGRVKLGCQVKMSLVLKPGWVARGSRRGHRGGPGLQARGPARDQAPATTRTRYPPRRSRR